MDKPQQSKENLSYKHDRFGFMLYYRGQPIGGMGTIRKYYIINDMDPRAKEYERTAKEHIKKILDGDVGNCEKTSKVLIRYLIKRMVDHMPHRTPCTWRKEPPSVGSTRSVNLSS